MKAPLVPLWKEAPFIRILIAFGLGIVVQWYLLLLSAAYWFLLSACAGFLLFFAFQRNIQKYRWYPVAGGCLFASLFAAGGLITHYHDIRHQQGCITSMDTRNCALVVVLNEPLSRRAASWKALVKVEGVMQHGGYKRAVGNLIIYFAPDPVLGKLGYGSRLLLNKELQSIRNAGNPGCFDYAQYAAFQNLFHQVYLRPGEYRVLPGPAGDSFTRYLFTIRERIVSILHTHVRKQEAGLAEALLIGYKDDLDKELVQSYANTGVVHIIAISGLHLGLIYWLLTYAFVFLKHRRVRWLQPLLIIGCLWIFSLITGGSASVMRSAVMFSCLVAGQSLGKRSSVFNSLAASAFLLLCYDPFWLWDAGFQLSYLALLSIVLFTRPFYHCFYTANKLLDGLLKLGTTTLAAQVLTLPIGVYLFHQFPVYFLITNIIAVPLSSAIVLAEIALCALAWVPWLAGWLGAGISGMIRLMNWFVTYMEQLPFSMWGAMTISIPQMILLYGLIMLTSCWLLYKQVRWMIASLGVCLVFCSLRSYSLILARQQERMIVYNIPKHRALDLVSGTHAIVLADTALLRNESLIRNTLAPASVFLRYHRLSAICLDSIAVQGFYRRGHKIVLVSQPPTFIREPRRIAVDVMIISGNPDTRIADLLLVFDIRRVVFDASNPAWKVRKWMAECGQQGVDAYDVAAKGAFVMNLD